MPVGTPNPPAAERDARTRLLDAALRVIRGRGYPATTVDDLCAEAGVTKGSFFHHFKSKEALALAAIDYWNEMTGALFAQAPYHAPEDPRERVLAYLDFRARLLQGAPEDFTCLLGTMVQETFATHPVLRDACERGIRGHAATVATDLALAKARYAPDAPWEAMTVALYTQAVLQGAFILAKAQGGPQVAHACVDLLRTHIETLLPS
ncbi:MAG: TetR/AcrR family transcriptional regulator [Burkholderiales bacterium]|nr:TetR/AcrR family transcriptional regulator [Burkholderiales bacterium]